MDRNDPDFLKITTIALTSRKYLVSLAIPAKFREFFGDSGEKCVKERSALRVKVPCGATAVLCASISAAEGQL